MGTFSRDECLVTLHDGGSLLQVGQVLLARYEPDVSSLLSLIEPLIDAGDVRELRKVAAECAERALRLRERTGA